jgi:hypothetical protein
MICKHHPYFVFPNHLHRENDHIAICYKKRLILLVPFFTHHSKTPVLHHPTIDYRSAGGLTMIWF